MIITKTQYQLAMLLDSRFKDVLCDSEINAAHLLQRKALDKWKQQILNDIVETPANEINTSLNSELPNNSKWSHFKKKTQSKIESLYSKIDIN